LLEIGPHWQEPISDYVLWIIKVCFGFCIIVKTLWNNLSKKS